MQEGDPIGSVSSKRFVCRALTVQYIICSTLGRSIASLYIAPPRSYLSRRLGKYERGDRIEDKPS